MAEGSGKGRRAGILGAAVGVVAAGAAVGFTVERLTIGRAVRRMAAIHDPGEPFGTLRGDPLSVTSSDGVELYVEVDEPRGWAAVPPRSASGRGSGGGPLNGSATTTPRSVDANGSSGSAASNGSAAPGGLAAAMRSVREAAASVVNGSAPRPTLLFTHGFCLPQDCWHYQRAEFSATHRMVFWDQRGHGRSERSPRDEKGRAKPVTIDQLGEDLYAVLQATCPEGPVILIGHSMGGMTMMALAARHPELFGDRIVGTALISTSAGRFEDIAFGLPRPSAKLLHRTTPTVLELLARQSGLVERGRALGGDLGLVLTRRYAFGSDVPESLVRYTQDLIQSVPIDVIADFYPVFGKLDMSESVPVFDRVPSLVLSGANDLVLPVAHSEALADAIPSADYVVLPNAGHALILEHPDEVGEALRNLVDRAEAQLGSSSSGRRAVQ
ncbi:alpha/beta hydrolase [Actinospica sp.]|uniref:alpha/beta fold hydrolase n=1 Tax=Actinospica sp. TaxID=1872142 RepID=UPI002CC85EDA|nr:alpha/beta hydrolase [Actinospica sp.]HWG28100.1 alpha/beta hydrolase [Actinospica sp.]